MKINLDYNNRNNGNNSNNGNNENNRNNRISTALLLAAGIGSRLLPLTQNYPKCLTLVNETSILERLVISLKKQGFKRLVIVTGYQENRIEEFLGSKSGDMAIEYIHSPLYRTTNNIYSLWMAREIIAEPFILLESDLVFDTSLLDGMIYPDRIAVAGIKPWMNGTTVTIDSLQKVAGFQNSIVPISDMIKYKTVNIYSFSLSSWRAIIERLNQHIQEGRVNGFYETVFSEMVDDGSLSLQAISFDGKPWYEIDTIDDLTEAVKLFPTLYYEKNISENVALEAS